MNQQILRFGLLSLLGAHAVQAAEIGIPPGGEPAGTVHATVDATFTYGIGAYSALGAQVHGVGLVSIWNTRLATGTFNFGALVGFQDEPMALQYGTAPGQTNDAQRLNLWLTVGHSFHLGVRRRASLGLHLFGGWTHVFSQASLVRPDLGIDRQVSDNYGLLNSGTLLKFDYRFSKYVGISLQAAVPFWKVQPSYVATIFHVGVGITAYLR